MEIELWRFARFQIEQNGRVMLLVVAESSGSSPGRAGYKMAVGPGEELIGSIGGGVMEVALVDLSRIAIAEPPTVASGTFCRVIEQVHQKNAPNASGMICSGRQTVILRQLTTADIDSVKAVINALENESEAVFAITHDGFAVRPRQPGTQNTTFERSADTEFIYTESLGVKNELFIIGGGHCALALSEIAAKLSFRVSIFDDRPGLNTLEKNRFADEITIIDSYESIASHVASGDHTYVVVMTLGYASDAIVIRQLIGRDFKYFGVLGSKAKMTTLMKELRSEGIDKDRLAIIRTPIGLPINSHTPEEIAVSIAAEIISVKNA